jgi:hypothetical protein
MQPDFLLTFDDLQMPEVIPGTRLHPLRPIGVGTPYVECLTSYMSRLAASHGVTVGQLIVREISPNLETQTSGGINGKQLNGTGRYPENVAALLETLTGSHGIQDLTLVKWQAFFQQKRILREVRAWCPDCYQQAKQDGGEIYDQLLWAVDQVKACPIHKRPLLSLCLNCGEEQLPFSLRLRPGFCAGCQEWLGVVRKRAAASHWDIWRAEAIGELLAACPKLPEPPNPAAIPRTLDSLRIQRGLNTFAAMSRLVGIGCVSIYCWLSGKHLPDFESVLMLCSRLEVSPLHFLTGNLVEEAEWSRPGAAHLAPRIKRSGRNRAEYRDALVKEFESASPEQGLDAIAKRAGLPNGRIRVAFPDIVQKHRERRNQYLAERKAAKTEAFVREVREAVAILKEQNREPTLSRVQPLLSKPRMTLSPFYRELLDQVLIEESIPFKNPDSKMPICHTAGNLKGQ